MILIWGLTTYFVGKRHEAKLFFSLALMIKVMEREEGTVEEETVITTVNTSSNKDKTSPDSKGCALEKLNLKLSASVIAQHGYRVSRLCERMGRQLGLKEMALTELSMAGLFHDLGKIAISRAILEKAGKLTEEEYREIKRHSEIGSQILSSVKGMENVAEYVLYHHERWDGKGYPRQLQGREIPLYSRVIGLADAYDAMTNNRSYRKALSKKAAIQELLWHSGTQFDPELVGEFIKIL